MNWNSWLMCENPREMLDVFLSRWNLADARKRSVARFIMANAAVLGDRPVGESCAAIRREFVLAKEWEKVGLWLPRGVADYDFKFVDMLMRSDELSTLAACHLDVCRSDKTVLPGIWREVLGPVGFPDTTFGYWIGDYSREIKLRQAISVNPAILGLTQAIREQDDFSLMEALADALEEAYGDLGLRDDLLLNHARGFDPCGGQTVKIFGKYTCPRCEDTGWVKTNHLPGCWLVELIHGLPPLPTSDSLSAVTANREG